MPNDIILWPDGFWCFREEKSESDSDDYVVLEEDTPEFYEFLKKEGVF